ncbi:hypothetical protein SAMN05444920_111158 [Nonomuraea solani]|uniref:Serine esterase n=1 Tax=Nonomuraea solani TaxID=1144553 RepID=A0A1H6EJE9_9ACTN|nr:hypothetical protein [Nonomuraea solani]SEG98020.1 hypothetical protein SAMN05444920_111158 [Nonomuraea solani]
MSHEPRIDVETRAQRVEHSLTAEQIERIAEALGEQGVWFATPPTRQGQARTADTIWDLVGDRPHEGHTATGRAAVHLAEGHTELTRPLILADGFGYGPSDLDGLWRWFNAPYQQGTPGFLDQLRTMGIDVVLLGFDQRHTHIQANAAVAVTCVQRVIAERQGDDQLVVGGISMGGIITRYALARMESERVDHQTDKYFSWDSPHLGAWIPLVLQQLAYLHEALQPRSDGPGQAELIRSPAAQQLLWGWVGDADYSGPVMTSSPLRAQFLDDLRRVGGFPARPYKLGLANGVGNGAGPDLPPGTPVFDLDFDPLRLVARIQPDMGELQNVGTLRFDAPKWTSATSWVPAFDGAPGGTLDSWGQIAKAMDLPIQDRFRSSCFVPAVSAIALARDPFQWQSDLYEDLTDLPKDETLLDAFCCDTANAPHGAVTRTLAEWFLEQLAGW